MNVGIHFSNSYWQPPAEKDFARLKQARPETIKTLIFPAPRFDQAAIHRRLRQEHPEALLVGRLYADMSAGAWSAADFISHFAPRIAELRDSVTWFEIHNEPNLDAATAGYSEGFGASDADADRFAAWLEEVLAGLRAQFPWARWVFPGQASPRYTEFWNRLLPTIQKFDAWGVHCYWEGDNHLHPYFGLCYTYAHYLAPALPIIITECGDATPGRAPAEKLSRLLVWFAELEKYDYVIGSALYILGNTTDLARGQSHADDDITEDMARAIGQLGRRPCRPLCADGFDFPVGKPDGTNFYVAAGVAEDAYYARFSAWHTGEDWNYIQGGAGHPVYAVAHGRVKTAQQFSTWGNIVLLEHRLADDRTLWSQYAHLAEMMVKPGDFVSRGQQIGVIGHMMDAQGKPKGPPHLHFELRCHELSANEWYLPRDDVLRYYLHPSAFINSHRPNSDQLVLKVDDADAGCVRSQSRFWFESDKGYLDHSYWTWTASEEQGEECWVEWRPKIPQTGLYEVFVFVPAQNSNTRHARYKITHRRGDATVEINQNDHSNEWVSLGTHPFSTVQPACVRLSDVTGEPFTRDGAGRRQIAFDAIMWTFVKPGEG